MDGWKRLRSKGPWNPAKHEPTKSLNKIKQAAVANDQNQPLGNPQQSLKDSYEDGDSADDLREHHSGGAVRYRRRTAAGNHSGHQSVLRLQYRQRHLSRLHQSDLLHPDRGTVVPVDLAAEWSVVLRSRREPAAGLCQDSRRTVRKPASWFPSRAHRKRKKP